MSVLRTPIAAPVILSLLLSTGACARDSVAPDRSAPAATQLTRVATLGSGASEKACWGQATQAFAHLGELGAHASQQSNPRLGLRNVARALYDAGLLPDDSMQALGAFLSDALGLSIDACL